MNKRRGKLSPMGHTDRLAKRVRNEKRKRVPAAVKWQKEHVATEPPRFPRRKNKARLRREAQAAELQAAIQAAVEEAARSQEEVAK